MELPHLRIEHMSIHGHGIARHEGQDIHILGAYTGDVVSASVYKKAYGITYAELSAIEEASLYRSCVPNTSPFYISHAPWLYLKADAEQLLKIKLIQGLFPETAAIADHPDLRIGYRNKGAYSFLTTKKGLSFSHYKRGKDGGSMYAQEENVLVHPRISKAAKVFLNFFNHQHLLAVDINYLILRYSYHTDSVSAQILVPHSSRKNIPWKKDALTNIITHHPFISGILVSQSPQGTRSTLSTQDFYHLGTTTISERMGTLDVRYHPSSFFQIYPHAFANIITDIKEVLVSTKDTNHRTLIDLFAGVGVIGLSLADIVQQVIAIEHSPLSKQYSDENALINGITNFSCHECSVDDALDDIHKDSVVVVDPPRSGLTHAVRIALKERKPAYVIYISCNPESQYHDLSKISDGYEVLFSKAYNIFPSTFHIEHVVILKRTS